MFVLVKIFLSPALSTPPTSARGLVEGRGGHSDSETHSRAGVQENRRFRA
jgi:hypothetical protein